MRITALLIIVFYIYACKEGTQKNEAEFELNKFEASSLGSGFHLGGGLCVYKDLKYGYHLEWAIYILSCYDSLPDTITPTENITRYKQGGLCFYYDCSVKPEKSFTMLMNMPNGFIDSNEYKVFASKYSDPTMLYKLIRVPDWRFKPSKELIAFADFINGKIKKMPEFDKRVPKKEKDTIIFFKEDNEFLEELFSKTKQLKIKNENFSDGCNSKFCSTKDFLEPLYEIRCIYGIESKIIDCYPELEELFSRKKINPKCLDKLERLSREYDILMHSGAFPAGDCDLGNWRYLKIDSLSKEHYEKLKDLVTPPDTISSGS